MKPVYLNTSLQLVGEATVHQSLTAELTLLNPLPELLQDCSFTIEGVGLTDGKPITKKYVNIATVIEWIISFRCFSISVGLFFPILYGFTFFLLFTFTRWCLYCN